MLRFEESKTLRQDLEYDIALAMEAAAQGGADQLSENISAGSRSGRQYYPRSKYPRRSSAEGEYPQEQLGNLKSTVGVYPGDTVTASTVGFFTGDKKMESILLYLEFYGDPSRGGKGVRRPLYMTFEGRDSRVAIESMNNAIIRSR